VRDAQGTRGGGAEISIALRRPALRKAVALCAGGLSKRTAVRISSGRRSVRPRSTRKRSSGSERVPAEPRSSTVASSVSSTGTRSAAGEALTMLPPTVAILRTCRPPITAEASVSATSCFWKPGWVTTASCVAIAPIA